MPEDEEVHEKRFESSAPNFYRPKGERLALTKNDECQVQLILSVLKTVDAPEINQKEEENVDTKENMSKTWSRKSIKSQVYLEEEEK